MATNFAVLGRANPPFGAETLDRMQRAQFDHDEKHHPEICRLTLQHRLTHMALHFAKYAGYLAEAHDDATFRRVVADVLIIATSSANALKLRLSDRLCAVPVLPTGDSAAFAHELMIWAGRMAAACEKIDHLEDFPFRQRISECVIRLLAAAGAVSSERGWDAEALVAERLQPIKDRSIFHKR